MGMFSEIATEGTIRDVLRYIDRYIAAAENDEVRETLKALARDVLSNCFDWEMPAWAIEARRTTYAARS
jgi:hypothetical protein